MIEFQCSELSIEERQLQADVREFLAAELPRGSFMPGLGMNAAKDPVFSAKLGERGWLGMALPTEYGGHERSAVDRFIVTEELLRWGAPVGHHWVADRQSGPVIAKFATEAQKRRFLPGICRGELSFCIGMSEPASGSDLASVTTRAIHDGDSWVLDGRKIWTTGADRNDWIVVLCRTSLLDEVTDKRQGLSQLIVDLRSPGVTASPIPFIDGTADFCEVTFDGVVVPGELVLGEIGSGWTQNMSELAYERGGADRWLSTYLVVEELLRNHEHGEISDDLADLLGEAVANYWLLHQLSLSVARSIDRGGAPAVESALVKEMGTRFEQDVLNAVLAFVDQAPNTATDSLFERLLIVAARTRSSVRSLPRGFGRRADDDERHRRTRHARRRDRRTVAGRRVHAGVGRARRIRRVVGRRLGRTRQRRVPLGIGAGRRGWVRRNPRRRCCDPALRGSPRCSGSRRGDRRARRLVACRSRDRTAGRPGHRGPRRVRDHPRRRAAHRPSDGGVGTAGGTDRRPGRERVGLDRCLVPAGAALDHARPESRWRAT